MKGHHLGSQAGPVATNLAIQWQPKTPLSWPSPGPTRRRSSAVRRPHPLTSPAASAMRVSPLVISIPLAACGCCWHCAHLLLIPIGIAGSCSGQRWRRARLEKLLICGLELWHDSLRSIRNKIAPAHLINIELLAASAACCPEGQPCKICGVGYVALGFGSVSINTLFGSDSGENRIKLCMFTEFTEHNRCQ
jgi:hypothetical protein